MITKTVFLASLDTGAFLLGYAGENEHIRYDIRCDSIFADYPDASVSMLIKSPDGTIYPKVVTLDKPSVYWVVTASDTATDGNGQVQITFTNGEEVIKTVTASTVTMPSLFVTGEEPDPIATWVDDANEVLALAVSGIPVEIRTEVAAQMSSTVDDWLEENITNPSSPPLDRSLTLANAAAPADLVGTKADAIYDTVTDQAIASVTDGADGMLVKALTVAVTPVQNLNGQSAPYPPGGGANLFGITSIVNRTNLTVTINADLSSITINGTASESSNIGIYINNGNTLPYGDYYYHCDDTTNRRLLMIKRSGGQSRWINSGSVVTIGETDYPEYVYYAFDSGTVFNNKVVKFQFNSPSSVTTYSPYTNVCPITGWTGANVYRTGKNLIHPKYDSRTHNNVTFTVNSDGTITTTTNGTASGAAYASQNWAGNPDKMQLIPAGTYKLSGGANANERVYLGGNYVDGTYFTQVYDTGSGATYTFTKPVYVYPQIVVYSGNASNRTFYIQLERGSTVTDFEYYNGTTYAIAFPGTAGTVYGGTLNVITGVLTVNRVNIVFTGAQSEDWGTYRSDGTSSLNSFRLKLSTETVLEAWGSGTANNAICNMATANGTAVYNHSAISFAIDSSQYAYICLPVTSVETLKTYLSQNNLQMCATLATPVTYTLTAAQVTTLLGTNNVWADCGNITKLDYPADTKLYINKVIAAAVAAL